MSMIGDMGLSINLSKTNCIAFGSKGYNLNISISGEALNEVKEIKYLGRIVAANNSAKSHVNFVIEKTKKTCRFLSILSGCRFGINPRRAIHLYKAFARSKIEYAASSFANLLKSAVKSIKTCTNNFLRRSLGLIRSTPTQTLYQLAGELPIELRLELATAKELSKCFAYKRPICDILIEHNNGLKTSYAKVYEKF